MNLFVFIHAATTAVSTLSLHDALPIYIRLDDEVAAPGGDGRDQRFRLGGVHLDRIGAASHDDVRAGRCRLDRKSTRLNSSHGYISYAVFCLKKKTAEFSPRIRSNSSPR